jgi:predicted N-acyltransferase
MSGGATVVDSLARVDGTEWDSILLPNRLAQSHRFHRALAASKINDSDYRYFRYRDAGGRLVAHCSFYAISTPLDLFLPRSSPAARVLAGVRSLYPGFLRFRVVECGSPTTLGYPVAFRAGLAPEERREIWHALVRSMESFAAEKQADLLVVRDFREDERPTAAPLVEQGFACVPNLENTVLRMRWATFDEYVGSLRAHYRRQVRLNLARAERAGLRLERVRDFAPLASEMARLWRLTHLRSTTYQREVLGPDYFENVAACLGDRTFAGVLRLGSRLVGFTLYLLDDTVLVPSYIGIDYAQNDEAALVFNAYYDWVRTGIDLGVPLMSLGITTYESKLRLGAEIEPLGIFIRYRRPGLTPALAAAYRWMTPRQSRARHNVFSGRPTA